MSNNQEIQSPNYEEGQDHIENDGNESNTNIYIYLQHMQTPLQQHSQHEEYFEQLEFQNEQRRQRTVNSSHHTQNVGEEEAGTQQNTNQSGAQENTQNIQEENYGDEFGGSIGNESIAQDSCFTVPGDCVPEIINKKVRFRLQNMEIDLGIEHQSH